MTTEEEKQDTLKGQANPELLARYWRLNRILLFLLAAEFGVFVSLVTITNLTDRGNLPNNVFLLMLKSLSITGILLYLCIFLGGIIGINFSHAISAGKHFGIGYLLTWTILITTGAILLIAICIAALGWFFFLLLSFDS